MAKYNPERKKGYDNVLNENNNNATQKAKIFIKDFFSKCDQIRI